MSYRHGPDAVVLPVARAVILTQQPNQQTSVTTETWQCKTLPPTGQPLSRT